MDNIKVKYLRVLLDALDDVNVVLKNDILGITFHFRRDDVREIHVKDSTLVDDFNKLMADYKDRMEKKLKEILKDE